MFCDATSVTPKTVYHHRFMVYTRFCMLAFSRYSISQICVHTCVRHDYLIVCGTTIVSARHTQHVAPGIIDEAVVLHDTLRGRHLQQKHAFEPRGIVICAKKLTVVFMTSSMLRSKVGNSLSDWSRRFGRTAEGGTISSPGARS